MIHRVRIILVRYLVDHCRFIQRADHVGSSRDGNPEYRLRESAAPGETFDLSSDQTAIDRARRGSTEERQTCGRDDGDAFHRLASELGVTSELALDARQKIFVAQARKAH